MSSHSLETPTESGRRMDRIASSLINGFKGALSLMHWKGQKAVAVFSSAHGYGSSGSGNVIPSYEPLIFEIEILPDE